MPSDSARVVRDVTVSKADRDELERLRDFLAEGPASMYIESATWRASLTRVVDFYDQNEATEQELDS